MVLLVFSAGGQRFAMAPDPVKRVVAAVETTPLPGAPAGVLGFFDFHGVLVPVLEIAGRRGAQDIGIDDRFLILQTQRHLLALVADAVHGVLDAPVGSLGSVDGFAAEDGVYRGVTRTDDGLVLIHDIDRFLSAAQADALDQALRGVEALP